MVCFYQVTNFFSTRYDSANASSARGPCNFGPVADLAISVFREVSINTLCVPKSSLLVFVSSKMIHEKNLSESLSSGTVIDKIFSEFLQPFRYFGMARVAPF